MYAEFLFEMKLILNDNTMFKVTCEGILGFLVSTKREAGPEARSAGNVCTKNIVQL